MVPEVGDVEVSFFVDGHVRRSLESTRTGILLAECDEERSVGGKLLNAMVEEVRND